MFQAAIMQTLEHLIFVVDSTIVLRHSKPQRGWFATTKEAPFTIGKDARKSRV
jgi:hypothetical protein